MTKYRTYRLATICFLLLSCQGQVPLSPIQQVDLDVCIYGATPSGILAALAVKREGKSVVIVEPSRWVGGMLGAGIKPIQDCPNVEAVGGMSRGLVDTLGMREGETEAWWAISPRDIRADFLALLKRNEIDVIYDHRVDVCFMEHGVIEKAVFDLAPYDAEGVPPQGAEKHDALEVTARIFIDASYEGDLLARAGVSFRTGRESTLTHGETLAGVRPLDHYTPIDPFVEAGNPASGLLKWVEPDHGKSTGSGDHYTQAYNFRFYVTSNESEKAPIRPPADYQPEDYELIGRYVDYLKTSTPPEHLTKRLQQIFPGWLNSGDYNYQRESLITMAPVGISHRYANGDYAVKSRIWQAHKNYLRGLHHFLSTDPRVPETYQDYVKSLGLERRHHPETNGWPHQLYIRVSRRLVGRYTITEHDVYNKTTVKDPIGLAQYGIDTYPSRRIVVERNDSLFVALGGKMFIGGAKGPTNVPYPIPYRAITPLAHECANLLVPVCFSATHLGYASARMEPVFMICGESSGIAAVQAIDQGVAVQRIDPLRYQQRLAQVGQILSNDMIVSNQ
ncbi:MAG: FAD-dependent oxidoreductase [Bacteroidota bacterium]